MSQAAHNLAAARAAVVTATERAEAAHVTQSKLLVRKSECEAASVAALSDFRAGKIDEATASLRKAAADADAGDVAALVSQGAAALQSLNVEVSHARAREKEAEHDFKREELSIAASELDKKLMQIEETLLECLAERARVQHLVTGKVNDADSLHRYWKPTKELAGAVTQSIVPAKRNA
ncbi:hypothetical protein PQR46_18610 [Paraburkholderia sediminicola]|uniref:hypothetical protein n=1 Tax=Paraburkholderia sediminicola TaxID=458836 RepID=UPI0038BB66FC